MGLYKTFAVEQPQLYQHMIADYEESLNDSENGKRFTPIRWKKSRNTAKRSARRTSAAKKIHLLEQNLDFSESLPSKKQTLILPIVWESEILAYSKTDIGEFTIEFCHKRLLWRAAWFGKHAHDKNPFRALAKLLGQKWGVLVGSGIEISMYDLYADIIFDWGQKPNVRNRTRRITETPKTIKMIYDYAPKMRIQPAWTPPPAPDHKPRINFGDFESEKSRV